MGRPRPETAFLGDLTPEQNAAADSVLAHETGVLAATTAFGKTVVAASVIAARGTNALVLVHRRQLMEQWIARLGAFLDLPAFAIGQVGGGKRKPTGIVDVAVPSRSPDQTHATCTPDTAWAAFRATPRLLPTVSPSVGFDVMYWFTTSQRRFTCVRLSDPHLPSHARRVPNAHDRRS